MNKMKKIIIAIMVIIIICLITFFSKDFIIRQYFIAKIENVDYDEYILTTSYNGKKKEIAYYTDDFCILRYYDESENLENKVTVYDYNKGMEYHYNFLLSDTEVSKAYSNYVKPRNINSDNILMCLKNDEHNQRKFMYKGIGVINNRECYILKFEDVNKSEFTLYLDKKILYTVRKYTYDIMTNTNVVIDYDLDLELKEKNIFKDYIK